MKIAPRKILLKPHVEADEQVAAAHFLDFELGHTMPAIAPRNRDHREAVAAHDRLQRQLDRDIEVRR